MEINLDWKEKLPAQEQCYNDIETQILLFSGGLGSGKTYFLCRKAILLSVLNRNHSGGILCPTYAEFKKDIYPTFDQIFFDLGLIENVHYKFHKTDKTYHFCWMKSNRYIYVFTGEKPIAGPNLAYCLINEHSLIHFERIKEMLRRVRVKEAPHKQRVMAGTPEDVHGWLEEFVELQEKENEKEPDSFKIVYADTKENKHLDESYRKHLESMLDEQQLKVFAGGQIVKLSGDYFYYAFSRQKNIGHCEYNPEERVHIAMDFNVGKMTASFAHKRYNREINKEVLYFFDEVLLKGDSDTYRLAEAIKNRFPADMVLITCDASGANRKTSGYSDVHILRSSPFNFEVRFRRANKKLRDRQILMNGLLAHGQIIIDPKCKNLIRDFEKVQQNKTDFTKVKDKDDRLTHFSDGADYLCDFEFVVSLRRSKTIQL